MDKTVPIKVEFTGGLEILFSSQRSHRMQLPVSTAFAQPNVALLIDYIVSNYLADCPRKDLFIMGGTVRPGILVLVNDADWELEGREECTLDAEDEVVFVSTLHGG